MASLNKSDGPPFDGLLWNDNGKPLDDRFFGRLPAQALQDNSDPIPRRKVWRRCATDLSQSAQPVSRVLTGDRRVFRSAGRTNDAVLSDRTRRMEIDPQDQPS
jgi:hypothetical protein